MAAAGAWKIYESFLQYEGDGTFNMPSDTFKCALFNSSSNALSALASAVKLGDLTNQLATANGYTSGGITLTSVTWSRSGGKVIFNCAAPSFAASGGALVARFAVIYKSGTANGIVNPLVCVCLLDSAPADVTVPDGVTLQLTINAGGIFDGVAA